MSAASRRHTIGSHHYRVTDVLFPFTHGTVPADVHCLCLAGVTCALPLRRSAVELELPILSQISRSSSPRPSSSTLDNVIRVCPSPTVLDLISNGIDVGATSVITQCRPRTLASCPKTGSLAGLNVALKVHPLTSRRTTRAFEIGQVFAHPH